MKSACFCSSPRPLWERPREARVRGILGFLTPLHAGPLAVCSLHSPCAGFDVPQSSSAKEISGLLARISHQE